MNAREVDRDYLARWARAIKVGQLLVDVLEADPDAS